MSGLNRGVRRISFARRETGFSLIEVMIAVLVLGVGLLAFAMLQTMSVRFSQSANKRTHATNLTYELLDQMRVNRIAAAAYAQDYEASSSSCSPPGSTVGVASFKQIWQCNLYKELGPGSQAQVTYDGGVVEVAVTWGDERWNDVDKDGRVEADESDKTFTVRTRL